MNIIECKNLTKEYLSGENVVKAVDDVTVSFEQGEFCAITGPSGSGKSTFLHVLSSLENPTSGHVYYGGKSLSSYNDNQLSILRRRRFGFVFQAYNLVQELTGYENILLPVMLDGKKPDEEYLNKVIDMLGIRDRLEHLPSALSGGQQQRIAIARALANRPAILFADEHNGKQNVLVPRQLLNKVVGLKNEAEATAAENRKLIVVIGRKGLAAVVNITACWVFKGREYMKKG